VAKKPKGGEAFGVEPELDDVIEDDGDEEVIEDDGADEGEGNDDEQFESVRELESRLSVAEQRAEDAENRARQAEMIAQQNQQQLQNQPQPDPEPDQNEAAFLKAEEALKGRLDESLGAEQADLMMKVMDMKADRIASRRIKDVVEPLAQQFYNNEANRQVRDLESRYGDNFETLKNMASSLLRTKPGLDLETAFELAEARLGKAAGADEEAERTARKKQSNVGAGGPTKSVKPKGTPDDAQAEFDKMMFQGQSGNPEAAREFGVS